MTLVRYLHLYQSGSDHKFKKTKNHHNKIASFQIENQQWRKRDKKKSIKKISIFEACILILYCTEFGDVFRLKSKLSKAV